MNYRGELIEEGDMVIRIGNSLSIGERQTDRGGRAASLRDLIRRY